MANEELLSRGSAFLVPRMDQDGGQVHICTSAHVVHPFAFPHYYEAEMKDWLRFVREKHVTCKIEARDALGSIIFQGILRPKVFRHSERDIAVLHAPDDEVRVCISARACESSGA